MLSFIFLNYFLRTIYIVISAPVAFQLEKLFCFSVLTESQASIQIQILVQLIINQKMPIVLQLSKDKFFSVNSKWRLWPFLTETLMGKMFSLYATETAAATAVKMCIHSYSTFKNLRFQSYRSFTECSCVCINLWRLSLWTKSNLIFKSRGYHNKNCKQMNKFKIK